MPITGLNYGEVVIDDNLNKYPIRDLNIGVTEIKAILKEEKLKGYSKLNVKELREMLHKYLNEQEDPRALIEEYSRNFTLSALDVERILWIGKSKRQKLTREGKLKIEYYAKVGMYGRFHETPHYNYLDILDKVNEFRGEENK